MVLDSRVFEYVEDRQRKIGKINLSLGNIICNFDLNLTKAPNFNYSLGFWKLTVDKKMHFIYNIYCKKGLINYTETCIFQVKNIRQPVKIRVFFMFFKV